MKRKQTRFTTEQEILDRIDRTKAKLQKLIAEELVCANDERLDKIRKAARRIEDSTLPRLKNALAAFRTKLLPITDDVGVVL